MSCTRCCNIHMRARMHMRTCTHANMCMCAHSRVRACTHARILHVRVFCVCALFAWAHVMRVHAFVHFVCACILSVRAFSVCARFAGAHALRMLTFCMCPHFSCVGILHARVGISRMHAHAYTHARDLHAHAHTSRSHTSARYLCYECF